MCSLNVANAVRQERTKLLCLLKKLKILPTMHKHKSLQIKMKVSCIVEICAERNKEFLAAEEQIGKNQTSTLLVLLQEREITFWDYIPSMQVFS